MNARPRPFAPLALSLALAFGLAGCGGSGGGGTGPASPGQPVPRFRLASLDGSRLAPTDFAGKVVVVDFWATWCVPCHAQAEVLERVHATVSGDKTQFLAVSIGEDEETVRRFVADSPFPYPVLLDPEDRVSADLGIIGLPTLMVVDTEGKVAYFEAGVITEEPLRRILAEAGA